MSDALAERLAGFRAVLDDRSLATGLVAVQGPRAVEVLAPLTDVDLGGLRYYAIAEGDVAGIPALVARTGYTGEDGFEVFVETGRTGELWDALLGGGPRRRTACPVGLGRPRHAPARGRHAALRQRARPRRPHPFEAGLGRVVKLDKPGDFVGRAALEKVAARRPDAPPRRASSSRAAGSPATATRSSSASGGPAS